MECSPYLYTCDPAKNTECKKTGCRFNPDAQYKDCYKTSNPKYSADGLVYWILKDGEWLDYPDGIPLNQAREIYEGEGVEDDCSNAISDLCRIRNMGRD